MWPEWIALVKATEAAMKYFILSALILFDFYLQVVFFKPLSVFTY